MTLPKAPRHLSARSKRTYRQIVAEYALEEAHHLDLLRLALEAVDQAEEARAALAQHGSVVYLDRFGAPRARPEVAIARDAAIRAARLFRELSLDPEYADETRVPRPSGVR